MKAKQVANITQDSGNAGLAGDSIHPRVETQRHDCHAVGIGRMEQQVLRAGEGVAHRCAVPDKTSNELGCTANHNSGVCIESGSLDLYDQASEPTFTADESATQTSARRKSLSDDAAHLMDLPILVMSAR